MRELESVSLEGTRGCGKTTTTKNLAEDFPNMLTNRPPDENFQGDILSLPEKELSPAHLESIKYHNEWEQLFDEEGSSNEPDFAEYLSLQKFNAICKHLETEIPVYKEYLTDPNQFILLDRYLDTVVVYGAAEVIISNPGKYCTEESRKVLINNMWEKILDLDPKFPDMTIFMISIRNHKEALERSWQTHKNYGNKYEINPVQEMVQNITPYLYLMSVEWSREHTRNRILKIINIDDKTENDVQNIVDRLINGQRFEYDNSNAFLQLYKDEPDKNKIENIEDLINIIEFSSTGAAFPGKQDVKELGASNCVYNNWALYVYAKELLNKKNLFFVSYEKDEMGDNPVHWCCIELSEDENKGRILDASPFGKDQSIGPWTEIKTEGDNFFLNSKKFSIESDSVPLKLMEMVVQLETKEICEALLQDAFKLSDKLNNSSKEIFWGIRVSRLLFQLDKEVEFRSILENLIVKYPNSLIIAREIAKNIKEGSLEKESFSTFLINAQEKLKQKIKNSQRSKEVLEYYRWIIEV
jgi:hypothetical protein